MGPTVTTSATAIRSSPPGFERNRLAILQQSRSRKPTTKPRRIRPLEVSGETGMSKNERALYPRLHQLSRRLMLATVALAASACLTQSNLPRDVTTSNVRKVQLGMSRQEV